MVRFSFNLLKTELGLIGLFILIRFFSVNESIEPTAAHEEEEDERSVNTSCSTEHALDLHSMQTERAKIQELSNAATAVCAASSAATAVAAAATAQ